MKVGFIGLGRMGKPMAINIVNGGFDVAVYDVREEPVRELCAIGAKAGASPKEIAEAADVISIVVVDDAQVEHALNSPSGVLAGARPGTIIAIHSTVLCQTVAALGKLAADQGLHLIDAPVSGGEAGARARKLCYMVGGDSALIERCRELFSTSASDIIHMGPLGSGAAAKMIVQVVTCINMLAAHEAEVLAEKLGLNPKALENVLHKSSGQSFVTDNWLDRFKLASDPIAIRHRRTQVFQKSLTPALETGQQLELVLSGAELARRLMPQIMGLDESRDETTVDRQ